MIFVSYLTDFSYFLLIKIFRKLHDMVRTDKKNDIESGCRWFQLFFIDFQLFNFLPESSMYIKTELNVHRHYINTMTSRDNFPGK